jgi:hypothetical protein
MSEPGLNNRLRQHSRRAGLMVGLSMALTIALCVGSFVYIYAWADPLTRDFVNASAPEPTRTPTREAAARSEEEEPADEPAPEDEPEEEEPEPTQAPDPTPTPDSFQPTHVISAETPINFRPGPAVASGDPVATLGPGTELQYLNESEPSQDPAQEGNLNWLRFRTADGLEGWIREIDVEPLNAGQ